MFSVKIYFLIFIGIYDRIYSNSKTPKKKNSRKKWRISLKVLGTLFSVGSNPNITNFELDMSNFELTRTQDRPPKPNFEPF